jgi:hypothetical protein
LDRTGGGRARAGDDFRHARRGRVLRLGRANRLVRDRRVARNPEGRGATAFARGQSARLRLAAPGDRGQCRSQPQFVDHVRPYPENPAYEKLASAICPTEWSDASRAATSAILAEFAKRHGEFALQGAISSGQYAHPEGVFFGGHAPTWSHRTIRTVFADWLGRAKHIGIVDFHTGLGPRGYGEIICGMPPGHPGHALAQIRYGADLTSPEMGTSTSPVLHGTNGEGFARFLAHARFSHVALEYGTLPVSDVLDAIRADNWLHLHGDIASEDSRRIKTQMRDAFAPADAAWREAVWTRAEEVLRKTAFGLAAD